MKVIVLMVIPVALIISSCANNAIKPNSEPVQPLVSAAAPLPQCDKTQRNLTHAWQDRQYWCVHENRMDDIKKQKNIRLLESIRQTRLDIIRVNDSLKKSVLTSDTTPHTNQKLQVKKIQILSGDDKAISLAQKNKPIFNEDERVMFASHREALGPKGRLSTKVIALAANDDGRIILRGFLAENEKLDELGKTHEQFSVGRALSVKNHLIKHGVPEKTITILHHRNIRPGAFVEVIFND